MNSVAADPALPLTFSAHSNSPSVTLRSSPLNLRGSMWHAQLPYRRASYPIQGCSLVSKAFLSQVPKVIFHILFVKNATDYSAGIG